MTALLTILAALALVLGAGVVFLMRNLSRSRDREAMLRAENARLSERLMMVESENGRREAAAEDRFKVLANDILGRASTMLRTDSERRLGEILTPLKDDLETLRRTVSETYNSEARERYSLAERVKELIAANNAVSNQAARLSEALRGNNKVQGDWGEMVLKTILERSGLQEGVHFVVQAGRTREGKALRNEEGGLLRPDVVVHYPGNRCVVVDSKVSLTAFMRLCEADNDEERRTQGARHVASVRGHIRELAAKDYQSYVGDASTDFVMMFIPNEPAYIAAMRLDPGLWQEAYDRRVLIVSPTHLVAALRLVSQLWRQDAQTRNAIEIATQAGRMYDKFVAFVDDMNSIDKGIENTRKAWTEAMRKLRDGTGNLVTRAERLRQLGAKTSKSLPGEDRAVR